jgi:hypothetical protein
MTQYGIRAPCQNRGHHPSVRCLDRPYAVDTPVDRAEPAVSHPLPDDLGGQPCIEQLRSRDDPMLPRRKFTKPALRLTAHRNAPRARIPRELGPESVIPKEGSLRWVDSVVTFERSPVHESSKEAQFAYTRRFGGGMYHKSSMRSEPARPLGGLGLYGTPRSPTTVENASLGGFGTRMSGAGEAGSRAHPHLENLPRMSGAGG